jgi:DNA-binding transcriptional LysR family regulator
VSLPSLEGIKRAVAMEMWVALLPRRCAESEITRGELVALSVPEIRLRRQVRLVFRKTSERSHTTAAFLATVNMDRSDRSGGSDPSDRSRRARTPKRKEA